MEENNEKNSEILYDEKAEEEEALDIPKGKRNIYTDAPKVKIKQLFEDYKDGKLIVRPYFQRGFVWDIGKASRLIESVLLNVPIPMIYSAEEKDGKEIIVDGQQRLISIFSFFDGKFPPENKTFWLKGLRVLKEFEGLKYEQLDESVQDKIKNYSIPFTIIQKDSDEEIKFDIFERLNTGSIQLNDQELRNCIYRGKYNELLRDLSENKDFQFILSNPRFHTRMIDCELILRFFAFSHTHYEMYKSPIKPFLNAEMEKYKNLDEKEIKNLREVFKNSVEITKTVFGNRAFRRFVVGTEKDVNGEYELSKFNKGLFSIIMVGFTKYKKSQVIPHADALREELLWLESNQREFIDSISGTGTDNTDKTHIKFRIWFDSLRRILENQKAEPRTFSANTKRQLFDNNPYCAICGQTIMTLDDAEVDHIDFYWRGGETILSNARLVHRYCNRARKDPRFIEDKKRRIIDQNPPKHKKSKFCTPQEEYILPILEVLSEIGGRGKARVIIERVGEKMKSKFIPEDLEKVETGGLRWEKMVAWERFKMVKDGLLKPDSSKGIWEITEIGKKYLANQKL